jgi:tetratricopeptide (TPR) repeat protein
MLSKTDQPETLSGASSAEAVMLQLDRVLSDPTFVQVPQLSRLLKYLVEHSVKGDLNELKEFSLGVEVFDRGASFDPRIDNIVRAHARRLRQRLEVYYAGTGGNDPILFDLPKGHYVVRFRDNPILANGVVISLRRNSRSAAWIAGTAVCAVALMTGLAWILRSPDSPPAAARAAPVIFVRDFDYEAGDATLTDFAGLAVENTVAQLVALNGVKVSRLPANANYVVAGSIRRSNEGYLTSVRLERADDALVLWTDSFAQNTAKPYFAKAQLVASTVEAIVNTETLVAMLPQIVGLDARREFANASIEWSKFTSGAGGNARVAIDHLRAAIRHAPRLWPAHVQLVILYSNRFEQTGLLPEFIAEAHGATRALLALRTNFNYDIDWPFPVALVSYRLDLDYSLAEDLLYLARAQGWSAGQVAFELGNVYASAGRLNESIAQFEASIAAGAQLDQAPAHVWLASTQIAAGRYRAARRTLERVLDTPKQGTWLELSTRFYYLMSLYLQGETGMAQSMLNEAWAEIGERDAIQLAPLYAMLGRTEQARSLLAEIERRYQRHELKLFAVGFLGYYYLNDLDRAFVWLDRVIDNREWHFIPHLKRARYLDSLRSDARFQRAMVRLQEIEARGSPLRTELADWSEGSVARAASATGRSSDTPSQSRRTRGL